MKTPSLVVKNYIVIESYCSNIDPEPEPDMDDAKMQEWLATIGYTYRDEAFGSVFFKTYEPMSFDDAKAQCESDRTNLPIPRSGVV